MCLGLNRIARWANIVLNLLHVCLALFAHVEQTGSKSRRGGGEAEGAAGAASFYGLSFHHMLLIVVIVVVFFLPDSRV